ncbi:HAD hydrolase-like protein [Pseudomonas sp. Marseille-QA0892]
MARYDLIIFDFDGTLADSFPWFIGTVNDVAHEMRFTPFDLTKIDVLRRMSSRELLAMTGLRAWRLPAVMRRMRQRMGDCIGGVEVFDGVADLVMRLKAGGIAVAVVTSNSEANVRAVLGPALSERIDHFECGASLFGKARQLEKVMARAGAVAGRSIYVGDETRDVEAARRAGVRFVGVGWGYAAAELLAAWTGEDVLDVPADLLGHVDLG